MSDFQSPMTLLQERYIPESYNGEEYMAGAQVVLAADGWLTRPLTAQDLSIAAEVLDSLYGFGLDVTDVHSFGAVWALRSTGAIRATLALDAALIDWRQWEETDHLGEPLIFLPDF